MSSSQSSMMNTRRTYSLMLVRFFLGLKHVERSPARHEQQRTELKLTLNAKVFDSKVIFPVVGQGLVEGCVLFVGHVLRLAHPEGLVFVQLLPFVRNLLDLFGFLLLGLLLLLFIHFLDLWLITLFLFILLFLLFLLRVGDFFLL